jgi:hypothetical protein
METPTSEPLELRAGDPWTWRRDDLGDYPATLWTLRYWFKNAAGGFEVVAGADVTAFLVDEDSTATSARAAGVYAWQARVENIASPSTRYTVASGTLRVLANLFTGVASDALDTRTHARKVLDAIEAVLENRATLDQEEYEIAGRRLKRTPLAELSQLRREYAARVAAEVDAERVANGQPSRNKLFVRF